MILDEKEQEELDKATSILSMVNEIELYSLLLKIKHSMYCTLNTFDNLVERRIFL